MACPIVRATAETAVSTAGTNHAITLPSGMVADDLILITMGIGSTSATLNVLTDWAEVLDESAAHGLKVVYYTGAGVPSTPTFVTSGSTRSASIAWRIGGANKTIAPEIGTTATGSSTTPNPPTVTPTGGVKDYLFIAFTNRDGEEADDDTWATASPTSYLPNPPLQIACGTVGTNLGGMVAGAARGLSAASDDPGTFTIATGAWRTNTVAVHPVLDSPVHMAPMGSNP